MSAFPKLFQPWTLAGRTLRNRVVFSAISSMYPAGERVTERLLDLYGARAAGGTAALVTEALKCHHAQPAPTRVDASAQAAFDGLQRWAARVEQHDCRLIGQFYDPGRGRHHPGRSQHAIGASALPDDLSWTVPRALSKPAIAALVAELAETAHRLQRAGFSGVELSCGHGHLFHQFLSPQANRREDEYGGSTENRTRLVRELIAAIRAACGTGFILGLKIVGDDGVEGGVDEAEAERIVRALVVGQQVDYLAPVRGAHHRTLEAHMPDRFFPAAPYRDMTRRIRAAAGGTPVLAVGRITTPDQAEALLAAGDCDAVMLGRALVADAGWAAKAEHGGAVRICVGGNHCWGATTAGKPLACDVNPRLGTPDELDWQPPKAPQPRRVVVVGAGPAGLEAAQIAARRGHQVTLLGGSYGGSLALQAALPGGGALGGTVQQRIAWAREAGVTMQTQHATADTILALRPDAVILATGSRMLLPLGLPPGTGALDARAAARLLLADLPPPLAGEGFDMAVLYDQDGTVGTYDLLELMADRFARMLLVTPREAIASEVSLVARQSVQRRVYGRRIPVTVFAEFAGFEAGVVRIRDVHTGDVTALPGVALLAYSTPRVPNDELAGALGDLPVLRAGDCQTQGSLMEAMAGGHDAGLAV